MEPKAIKGITVKMNFDYKGGSIELNDTMPHVSEHEDFVKQYIGIWRVMFDKVQELKAWKVVEFGTRE